VIDAGDYGIIDNTFQLQGPPLVAARLQDVHIGAGGHGVTPVGVSFERVRQAGLRKLK